MAAGCACILLIAVPAVVFDYVQWPLLPGFNWAYATVHLVAGLITAVLLMQTGPETWSWSVALLAAGCVFSALATVPFLLSFPGAFGPDPLVGGPQSAPWAYYMRLFGFLSFVCASTVLAIATRRRQHRPGAGGSVTPQWVPSPILTFALGTVAALPVTVLVLFSESVLPDVLIGYYSGTKTETFFVLSWFVVGFGLITLALAVVAARDGARLRVWLVPVALLTVVQAVLPPGVGRYRVGWYAPRILGMIATMVLLVALLIQVWRQSRALTAAQAQSLRLAQIVEQAPAGYALLDSRGFIVDVNQALCDITGYPREKLVGAVGNAAFETTDVPSADIAQLLTGTTRSLTLRRRLTRPEGSTVWVDVFAHRLTDAAGRTSGVAATVTDASGEVAADLDPQAPVATAFVSADGLVTRVSEALCALVGQDRESLVGQPFAGLVVAEDRAQDMTAMDQLRGKETEVSGNELRLTRPGASPTWVVVYRSALRDAHGMLVGAALQLIDITDRKRAEATARRAQSLLEQRSTYDDLTGLLNRPTFVDHLQAALEAGATMVVLVIDIDGFRRVGNTMTRREGDLVIVEVAKRLRPVIVGDGMLARIGGDEFALAIPVGKAETDVGLMWAGSASDAVAAAPVGPAGRQVHITCGVGVTVGESSDSAADLMQEADLACREAQESGRGRCSVFDRRVREDLVARIALIERVRAGLAAAEFVAWFQPVVALGDGHLDGYEALTRWIPGDGAIVTPDVYLPAAEDSGLIVGIGTATLEAAVARLARLPEPLTIAINASPTELLDDGFTARVDAALARHQVNPRRLVVEITEQAIFDVRRTADAGLAQLANLGIRLYVDDFGTGYSSFTHLRDLPIAGIKLDRSFTAALDSGHTRAADIAATLADLATRLDIDSVAEGIETQAQADLLAAMGWRHGQGFLFGRPAPEVVVSTDPRASSDSTPNTARQ